MKKTRRIISVFIYLAFSVLFIFSGLFITDSLPRKLSYKINSFISGLIVPANSSGVISQPSDNTDSAPVAPRKLMMPDGMTAMWLDLDSDIASDTGGAYSAFLTEADSYFNYFDNFHTNAVFIKPDAEYRYSGLCDENSAHIDLLREYMSRAQAKAYLIGLVIDDSLLYGSDGSFTFDNIKYYLSNYAFDAAVLYSDTLTQSGRLREAAEFCFTGIKSFNSQLHAGVVLTCNAAAEYADAQSVDILNSGLADFVFIKSDGSVRSSALPFSTVMSWWNELAKYYTESRFYICHRADLLNSGAYEWNSNSELADELKYMWDFNNIYGSVFCGARDMLAGRKSFAQRAAYLIESGQSDMLKVKTLTLDSQNNYVAFTGVSDYGHRLLLNRTVADSDGGGFNLRYALAAGENNFHFFSCGKELVYRIYSNIGRDGSAPLYNRAPASGYSVTPYVDNGLGTSLMCRIFSDDTEQLGPAGAYNTYQADFSTLCSGTLDYVKNITVSEEGYIRYELSSGISVYGVNCELINNAYTMPENKITVGGVNETASSTDIVFGTDWLVPVTVKTLPQSYSNGYLNYSYNISSYTAEYVDITFHHTAEFFNQALLTFAADSPFTRNELYRGANGTMILRLYLRQKGQFYGFDIYTDEYSRLVLSFKKHANGSLSGKVIMLDPGHGGLAMTGTALSDESVSEADVTLSIALKVRQMLTEQGAAVIMTRYADTPLDLDERCRLLSLYNPDIFVSVHCDGSDGAYDSGTHTFYFRPYSQPLANAVNSALVYAYQNHIYAPGDTNYSSVNRGIKYYPFYVTRLNQCPSVLVETGFMTNYTEGRILADNNSQYWLAQGITDGIVNYFARNNATVAG